MAHAVLLRPMALADLSAVLDIQRACYSGDFLEDATILPQRLHSPGNLSCVATRGGVVCAYLAAYRSRPGKLTPLNGGFDTVAQPDTLYLHDLAVAPQAAGQGLAQQLVSYLWARAAEEQLCYSALVSVHGSQVFWERLGYRVQARTPRRSSRTWRPTARAPATWPKPWGKPFQPRELGSGF